MTLEFSPGVPMVIEAGRAPFGVVLRVVFDDGTIVVEQTCGAIAGNKLLHELAEAGTALMTEALEAHPEVEEMTVCGYDGDDGMLLLAATFGRDGNAK